MPRPTEVGKKFDNPGDYSPLAALGRSFPIVLIFALLLVPVAVDAAPHPRLVDVATTRCTDCHDDLWPEGAIRHSPVEDCTTCHEFSTAERKTEVRFPAEGPELCLICHDELRAAVAADLKAAHPVTDSCTTCHHPHASVQARLLTSGIAELCYSCHDSAELQPAHGEQLTAASDCRGCHRPHGSNNAHMLAGSHFHPPFADGSCKGCHRKPFGERIRLRSRGETLCLSCHSQMALPRTREATIHAAMWGERGRAGCLSCHDPHMSANRRLLVAAGNALCSGCHTAVAEKASGAGGHAAAEDCLSCHLPHRADQRPLLNQARAEICVLCHDAADGELRGVHLGAELDGAKCIRCHDPHGSEHSHLLAENLHSPILDGCDLCHDGAWNRFAEDPSKQCLTCHDEVGTAAAAAKVPHSALDGGGCVNCHNPHATSQEYLVKVPSGGVCFDCHGDVRAGEGETAHRIIDLVGCRACHESHGGERPKLLRREPSALCLGCHGPEAVPSEEGATTVRLLDRFELPAEQTAGMTILRLSADGQQNHPVTKHRTLGQPTPEELAAVGTTYEGGELTCLTCHDPHKGRVALLAWNVASTLEACLKCHPK